MYWESCNIKLFPYTKGYRHFILLGVLCSAGEAVLELMLPYLMEIMLDEKVPAGDLKAIYLYGGGMMLCTDLAEERAEQREIRREQEAERRAEEEERREQEKRERYARRLREQQESERRRQEAEAAREKARAELNTRLDSIERNANLLFNGAYATQAEQIAGSSRSDTDKTFHPNAMFTFSCTKIQNTCIIGKGKR